MRPAALVIAALAAVTTMTHADEPPSNPTRAAEAWDREPDGYRGLKWGDSWNSPSAVEVLGTLKAGTNAKGTQCMGTDRKDEFYCTSALSVGPTGVKDLFIFLRESLVGASMFFDADDYDKLRGIFIEKYGPPTSRTSKEVQNRMGASFQQEELEWKGKTVSISLSRFGSKLTEGSAHFITPAYEAHLKVMADEEKKKASKAF